MKNTLSVCLYNILFFLCFFFCSSSLTGQGQHFSLHGTISGAEEEALAGATAVLLAASDSVLVAYGISSTDGRFELKRIKAGNYLLQVSYVGYTTFSEAISLSTADVEKVKQQDVQLTPNVNVLDQVEVSTERIPIQIKGDTIEYNAAAFKTQANAAVEDLLRQLPGVEVGRDGTVKAQGKDVEHVYVDGKEFFGDDPQMATKNLPADAIEKVQVFDKGSDSSELTGIDDGRREKTINLTLKEDKKNGVFGTVNAGYGNRNRYEGKANINRFNSKLQFSAIGMANNTNQQGFSLGEYIEFMGGLSNLMSGGGGSMRMSFNSDDLGIPLGNDLNNGLVETGAGGLNFNFDFSKKTKLRSSYFFNRINNQIEEEINRDNFLSNGENYRSEQSTKLLNRTTGHRLNLNLEHEIDPSQTIRLRSSFSVNNGQSASDRFSQTFNTENTLENSSQRQYDTQAEQFKWNSTLLYRKRFKKLGRVLVTDLTGGVNNNRKAGQLDARNNFSSYADSLQQRQTLLSDQFNYQAKASYIEPLGKRKYLELSYALNNTRDEEIKDFYDRTKGQQLREVFNDSLSRHFANDYRYNTGGLSFKLNRKNYQWTLALRGQHSQLRGNLISQNQKTNTRFLNLLPRFFLNYDLSSANNFSLQYNTAVNAPTIAQLNPVVDNNDPLNLYIGNPQLRPEYAHQLNMNFSSFNQFSFTNIFASASAVYARNKIYDARTIDSLFRQVIRPINVKEDLLLNGYFSFGTPLRFIKSRINLTLNAQYNRSIELLNDISNNTNRFTNVIGLSLENRKKEILDISLGAEVSHNISRYSVSTDFNQTFFNQTYYADLQVNFAKSWAIESVFDVDIYSAESFAGAQIIPVWKASLSKFILEERGEFKFFAGDLLNQNIRINRSSSFNYIQEQKVRSLGRYFLVSFTWKISKFGSPSAIHIDTGRR